MKSPCESEIKLMAVLGILVGIRNASRGTALFRTLDCALNEICPQELALLERYGVGEDAPPPMN